MRKYASWCSCVLLIASFGFINWALFVRWFYCSRRDYANGLVKISLVCNWVSFKLRSILIVDETILKCKKFLLFCTWHIPVFYFWKMWELTCTVMRLIFMSFISWNFTFLLSSKKNSVWSVKKFHHAFSIENSDLQKYARDSFEKWRRRNSEFTNSKEVECHRRYYERL